MKNCMQIHSRGNDGRRRGSTLVIVIALLGLLMFTGIIFYTFAAQERIASEYFSEAAKAQYNEPTDVWAHMLEQLIVGPPSQFAGSKLSSPMNRHSMMRNLFGNDIYPNTGNGIPVRTSSVNDINMNSVEVPVGPIINGVDFPLEMVDSPSAWGYAGSGATNQQRLASLNALRLARGIGGGLPEPDAGYTYPDINTMFLAQRGYATTTLDLNDGNGPRKQLVPYIIPSFMRPQYMRSAQTTTSFGAVRTVEGITSYVPTDPYWAYAQAPDSGGGHAIPEKPDNPASGTDNRDFVPYQRRSFRPHPRDIAGITDSGVIALRYLTDTDASDPNGDGDTSDAIAAGGFPMLPDNDPNSTVQDPNIQGELGVWTGSNPLVYELDFDNDGDGIREGIVLDLHFPVQDATAADGSVREYVVMYSMTIYDLDALLNLNVHGNLAGMPTQYTTTDSMGATTVHPHTLRTLVSEGELVSRFLSRSNLGMGPNEVNPVHALRRSLAGLNIATNQDDADFAAHLEKHFGAVPNTDLELANMLWIWLLMGRGEYASSGSLPPVLGDLEDIYQGRWGDERLLFASLENRSPALRVTELPRPGRSGNVFQGISGISFGGRNGFDDNANALEGEPLPNIGKILGYGHPVDFGGTGLHYLATQHHRIDFNEFLDDGMTANPEYLQWDLRDEVTGTTARRYDPRVPIMLHDSDASNGPERWRGYIGYSRSSNQDNTDANRYYFGPDGEYDGGNAALSGVAGDTSDDLVQSPVADETFEDPLETIFDPDLAQRPLDDIFVNGDLLSLHLSANDFDSVEMSERLTDLAPHVFSRNQTWTDNAAPLGAGPLRQTPDKRQMFTPTSNDFRYLKLQQPFGSDGRPGQAGIDDDDDGVIDEASEAPDTVYDADPATSFTDSDQTSRWWEWSADSDGFDRNDDGFGDGDGYLEFPPRFWNDKDGDGVADYNPTDAALNEVIQVYSAEDPFRPALRRLLTVEAGETRELIGALPMSLNHILDVDRAGNRPEEGTAQFLYWMQQAGLRFRGLTDHPHLSETGVLANTSTLSSSKPSQVQFPPATVAEREYWARLDRQRMARDIYVLLYTIGGARVDGNGDVRDYTGTNDPMLGENSASSAALYTQEQLRRMAQFAVNIVDAMDNDGVATKFEYDKNLGNGWNLDDNAYTADFSPALLQSELDPSHADYAKAITDLVAFKLLTGDGRYREDSGEVDAMDVDMDMDTTEIINVERGVVFGVETQQLTFSETLAVRSNEVTAGDAPTTPYDDTTGDRDFLIVELQSMIPQTLDLATTASTDSATAIWRVARFDRTVGTGPSSASPRSDLIRPTNLPTRAISIIEHGENEVDGGGRFSIAAASDTGLGSSAIYLDLGDRMTGMFDGTYELIAPDVSGLTLPATPNSSGSSDYPPLVDIDVIHDDHSGGSGAARYEAVNGNFLESLESDYAGNDVYEQINNRSAFATDNALSGFDLVLQRRANPNMPNLSISQNPWIEVDRTKVVFRPLNLQDTDTPVDIFDGTSAGIVATRVVAVERDEPLNDAAKNSSAAKAATPYRLNTLKGGTGAIADMLGVNSRQLTDTTLPVSGANPATPFDLWQPHFDREFTSTAELLSISLMPPGELTHRLHRTRLGPYQQGQNGTNTEYERLAGAAAMLLMPDFTDVASATPTADEIRIDQARDNRWYRLFEFVEVPSRVHRMLGNYMNLTRVPGKLNLNTIRHLEVYAGLLDDPVLAQLGAAGQDLLKDSTTEGVPPRDRWEEFVSERDGDEVTTLIDLDPANPGGGTAYTLTLPGRPGSTGSAPFQSTGQVQGGAGSLNNTVFRQLNADIASAANNRNWLEIGEANFHQNPADPGLGVNVKPNSTTVQRHQLLSKIMNNVTTTSNTFIVYGTAAYYQAYTDPVTGFVRVGGRIDLDNTSDNGDLVEDAGENHDTGWQQRAFFVIDRTDAINAYDSGSGTFDWQRLVRFNADLPPNN